MKIRAELGYQNAVVVFDLDDTLYPERDFAISGYNAVCSYILQHTHSLPSIDAGVETMTAALDSGNNPFDVLESTFPGSAPESRIPELLNIYRYHTPHLTLPQASLEILQYLGENGIRMGIITDGRSKTQRNKIEALGISGFFAPDNILISEETGKEKTTPEPFIHFVHRYVNARKFIYVGDNPSKDFKIPNMLGWETICLLDGGHNIHPQNQTIPALNSLHSISSLVEIRKFL